MPRPKGSKNKKTTETSTSTTYTSSTRSTSADIIAAVAAGDVKAVDQKIAPVEAEIEQLTNQLKSRKSKLKQLAKDKVAAAERKAEEDKKAILDAVAASGKSVNEILEMLRGGVDTSDASEGQMGIIDDRLMWRRGWGADWLRD